MTTTPTPAPEADVQDFANMSAALTGFLSSVLKPKLDPVGLARTYYEFALAQVGAAQFSALLNAFRAIQTQPPQTIADTLLETSSSTPSAQALLAQSIIALWYLGAVVCSRSERRLWLSANATADRLFRGLYEWPCVEGDAIASRWASAPLLSAIGAKRPGRYRISA